MSRSPVYTMMIDWERLLDFLRSACSMPQPNGSLGRECDATPLMVLKQEDLVEKCARRLYEIDARYKEQVEPLKMQIRKLNAIHRTEEQALAAELRGTVRELRLFEQWLGVGASQAEGGRNLRGDQSSSVGAIQPNSFHS